MVRAIWRGALAQAAETARAPVARRAASPARARLRIGAEQEIFLHRQIAEDAAALRAPARCRLSTISCAGSAEQIAAVEAHALARKRTAPARRWPSAAWSCRRHWRRGSPRSRRAPTSRRHAVERAMLAVGEAEIARPQASAALRKIGADDRRIGEHVGGRAFGDLAAAVHHDAAVAQRADRVHDMLDQHDGDAVVASATGSASMPIMQLGRIEAGEPFVEQQQARLRARARARARAASGRYR